MVWCRSIPSTQHSLTHRPSVPLFASFCRICDADEVVLFERATFLVIAHAQAADLPLVAGGPADSSVPGIVTADTDDTAGTTLAIADANSLHGDQSRHMKRTELFDNHRFEKISNIIKQFKLSVGKAQSQFQGMEVRNSRFSAFIDAFTANTYIMVIVSNPAVHTAATLLNIQNARNHFELMQSGV